MKAREPIAIVTDALWRKSVSAIRALGNGGYKVFAMGDSRLTTGFYSRYTTRRFLGPTAANDADGFGEILRQAVEAAQGEPVALLPMEDATCEWLIARGADLPPNVRWLLPHAEGFAVARDKARTQAAARELGIPCPATLAPSSPEELQQMIAANRMEDFVLKPRTGSGSSGIVYGEHIRRINSQEHWHTHGPLILQERIPSEGEARGVSYLYDGAGRSLAAFAHRRLRQYPVSGGPSTQRESVALDELHEYSRRLLDSLNWRGPAMVEWKVHPTTRRPMLLEINPRFWGSLALAVAAKADFPVWYATAALDRPGPMAGNDYRTGVVSHWLIPGDILRYLSTPREQREPLGRFLRDAASKSEEFDSRDWAGSIACCLCPALLAANPKYWRYVRRDSTPRP
jgi:predicted ATP-grasp superfamily ATP-dependent carboligase